jgi:hypothetical protein
MQAFGVAATTALATKENGLRSAKQGVRLPGVRDKIPQGMGLGDKCRGAHQKTLVREPH